MKKYVRNVAFIFAAFVVLSFARFLGRGDYETLSDWFAYVQVGAHINVPFWTIMSLVGGYLIIRIKDGLDAYEQRLELIKAWQLREAEKRREKRRAEGL